MPILLKRVLMAALFTVTLSACSEHGEGGYGKGEHGKESSESKDSVDNNNADRWYTESMVSQGKPLYQANCAQCHGGFGQGSPDWRKPTDDGRYLPPPLNGTGHAWHHSLDQLRGVIKYGRGPGVPSDMPAWGEKLSDEEINAVMAWFQSRWPDEIYQVWSRPKH